MDSEKKSIYFTSSNKNKEKKNSLSNSDSEDDESFSDVFKKRENKNEYKPTKNKLSKDSDSDSSISWNNLKPQLSTVDIVTNLEQSNACDGEEINSTIIYKKILQCPLCFKKIQDNNSKWKITHFKQCASKLKITTEQLFKALKLELKGFDDRQALGLPTVCNTEKTPQPRRNNSNKLKKQMQSKDPDIQLAMALSASLQEAQEVQVIEESSNLFEAGLEEEANEHCKILQKLPVVIQNKPFAPKKDILKSSSVPTLLLRSKQERERILSEKIALIMCSENENNLPPLLSTGYTLNSKTLHTCLNPNSTLWELNKLTNTSDLIDSDFYNKAYLRYDIPQKFEVSTKKQVCNSVCLDQDYSEGELNTLRELRFVFKEAEIKKNQWEQTRIGSKSARHISHKGKELKFQPNDLSDHLKLKELKLLSKAFTNMIGENKFSDIMIYTKEEIEISAHKIIIHSRSPDLLKYTIKETTASGKTREMLCWNIELKLCKIVLAYIYGGTVDYLKIVSLNENEQLELRDFCSTNNIRGLMEVIENNNSFEFGDDTLGVKDEKENVHGKAIIDKEKSSSITKWLDGLKCKDEVKWRKNFRIKFDKKDIQFKLNSSNCNDKQERTNTNSNISLYKSDVQRTSLPLDEMVQSNLARMTETISAPSPNGESYKNCHSVDACCISILNDKEKIDAKSNHTSNELNSEIDSELYDLETRFGGSYSLIDHHESSQQRAISPELFSDSDENDRLLSKQPKHTRDSLNTQTDLYQLLNLINDDIKIRPISLNRSGAENGLTTGKRKSDRSPDWPNSSQQKRTKVLTKNGVSSKRHIPSDGAVEDMSDNKVIISSENVRVRERRTKKRTNMNHQEYSDSDTNSDHFKPLITIIPQDKSTSKQKKNVESNHSVHYVTGRSQQLKRTSRRSNNHLDSSTSESDSQISYKPHKKKHKKIKHFHSNLTSENLKLFNEMNHAYSEHSGNSNPLSNEKLNNSSSPILDSKEKKLHEKSKLLCPVELIIDIASSDSEELDNYPTIELSAMYKHKLNYHSQEFPETGTLDNQCKDKSNSTCAELNMLDPVSNSGTLSPIPKVTEFTSNESEISKVLNLSSTESRPLTEHNETRTDVSSLENNVPRRQNNRNGSCRLRKKSVESIVLSDDSLEGYVPLRKRKTETAVILISDSSRENSPSPTYLTRISNGCTLHPSLPSSSPGEFDINPCFNFNFNSDEENQYNLNNKNQAVQGADPMNINNPGHMNYSNYYLPFENNFSLDVELASRSIAKNATTQLSPNNPSVLNSPKTSFKTMETPTLFQNISGHFSELTQHTINQSNDCQIKNVQPTPKYSNLSQSRAIMYHYGQLENQITTNNLDSSLAVDDKPLQSQDTIFFLNDTIQPHSNSLVNDPDAEYIQSRVDENTSIDSFFDIATSDQPQTTEILEMGSKKKESVRRSLNFESSLTKNVHNSLMVQVDKEQWNNETVTTPYIPQPSTSKDTSITPIADYSRMDTPSLKKELSKYGLKRTLGKKKAKLILKHFYEKLHPEVGDEEERPAHRAPKQTVPNKEAMCTNVRTSEISHLEAQHKRKIISRPEIQYFSDDATNSDISESYEVLEESIAFNDLDGSVSVETTPAPPLQAFTKEVEHFLRSEETYRKILRLAPLWLEHLQIELRSRGVRRSIEQLMNYMDEMSIIFRTKRKPRKVHKNKRGVKKRKSSQPGPSGLNL